MFKCSTGVDNMFLKFIDQTLKFIGDDLIDSRIKLDTQYRQNYQL